MKKIIVLVYFLFFSSFCFCQECKFYEKEIIEEISGSPVLFQKFQNGVTSGVGVGFSYCTNRCWILLDLYLGTTFLSKEMHFNFKTPVVFIFNDSSYLELFPSMEYSASVSLTFFSLRPPEEGTTVFYTVSKENVELLASKKIQIIRIYYSPIYYVGEIKDSTKIPVLYKEIKPNKYGIKHIQTSSKCILNVDFNDPDTCLKQNQKVKSKNENKSKKTNSSWYNQTDTSKFSMIYMVFNDGQDETQSFPVYFNNKYICKLKNHMRLSYKVFSYGTLSIERREEHMVGPSIELLIKNGESYGVSIKQPSPGDLDHNKRFTIKLKDEIKFEEFMKNEFFGFKPFKKEDLKLQEDLNDPIL